MYDEVAKEMVDAGIAVEFPVPVWMDHYGNIVEEDFAYGCQVTHDVKRPANCFALDELGATQVRREIDLMLVSCLYAETARFHKLP